MLTPPSTKRMNPEEEPLLENEEDEERRRQQQQEEAMEALMRAQEEEDQQQMIVNENHEEGRQEQPQQPEDHPPIPTYSRPKIPYVPASFCAALGLVFYALRTRQQWYLALLYLTSSKWAYLVLGNALIAACIWIFRFFTKNFLQGLRLAEAEGLGEFFRWNVTETCLALTMFRTELEVSTFLVFLLLILAKCLHWVAELREQHLRMTQEAIVPCTGTSVWRGGPVIPAPHLRLSALLLTLIVLDICAVTACGQDLAINGPSVSILFAFETAILLVTAMSSMLLWILHVLDGWLHYLHDQTPWVHSWLHAWKDKKATLTFAVEVQAQGAKFLFYVTFFAIVLTYYGLPINLFREVYVSFMNLKNRLLAFAKYRRLMASMNRFASVDSEEALDEAGRVCIICRDDMTLPTCKKLPGCEHVFHASCLREWLVQQQSCPTCRGDITAMEARDRAQRQREQRRQEREANEAQQAAAQETTPPPSPSGSIAPSMYRVNDEGGAQVFNEDGELVRTLEFGLVILCTKMKWKTIHGGTEDELSGIMLYMPDGWVFEKQIDRLCVLKLPGGNKTASLDQKPAAVQVS